MPTYPHHPFTSPQRTHTPKHQQSKHTSCNRSNICPVQKCGSSICQSFGSSNHGSLWNRFKRTASPPQWPVCLFIKRGGGVRALPRSIWGHTILSTWIHKWMAGSTATPCRTGPWLVPCTAGINTLRVYIMRYGVTLFQETRTTSR